MMGYNNPTWYLCVLIQCYLVYYAIRGFSNKTRINRIYLDALVVVSSLILRRLHLLPHSTGRGLQAFSIGLILFGIADVTKLMTAVKHKIVRIFVAIIGVVSISIIALIPSQQRYVLMFLTFPVIVLESLRWNGNTQFEKTISLLGKVSFEVYLWHYPLMAVEQMFNRVSGFKFTKSYLTMAVFTVFIWCFGWMMYEFIEKPVNRLVRKEIKEFI